MNSDVVFSMKKDGIATELSKRHSDAVKRGIKVAKKIKKSVIKAKSRAIGKKKCEIASQMFDKVTDSFKRRVKTE